MWSETYFIKKSGQISRAEVKGPAKKGRDRRGSFIKKIKVFS